jgi:hypothetical protein
MRVIAGDIVTNGDNVGVVRELFRGEARRPDLKVEITKGPMAPGWAWPEGWTPQLGEGSYPSTCATCGREFKAPMAFEVFCATCNRLGAERMQAEHDAGGYRRDRFDRVRWRNEERPRGRNRWRW